MSGDRPGTELPRGSPTGAAGAARCAVSRRSSTRARPGTLAAGAVRGSSGDTQPFSTGKIRARLMGLGGCLGALAFKPPNAGFVVALMIAGLLATGWRLLTRPLRLLQPRITRRNIFSYEGGLFLQTNGSVPNGPCFRISGHVAAAWIFRQPQAYRYRRREQRFRRGSENITQFPDQILP